ncbi:MULTISPECIES: ABC transporter substrate-binding protein [unclassified Knoellia]|uniref:ABC transporter substrate-binding protein n=1 Tax=Knoellia altitudinis TaxID=3404795 RepID=UPI003611F6B8
MPDVQRRTGRRRRTAVVGLAGVISVGVLGACAVEPQAQPPDQITVWIQEDLPDRVAATQKIVDRFTAASGVSVELVPVAEDQFNQLLISNAAAGSLPDVVGGISLPQVRTLSANELLDTDAVARVMDSLDESTFTPRALELTRDGEDQLVVPSESWAQILVYRKDLFDKAGLQPPTTYESITAAAKALDSDEVAGFVGGTAPGDAFTVQTFEHVALGNGCELVDEAGEVTLESKACEGAFRFFGDLVDNYSVPGAQDVDTSRAAYFAGQAAMLIWSTFVLDEMAGLRDDAKPSCPQCRQDPAFLAKNSGVVTAIAGPEASEPAVFGEITSWGITAESSTDAATQFVEYMMSDGYPPWIGIAPEGKVPVRTGTPDKPTTFSDQWATLPAGVDTKAPLSDFYAKDVLDQVAAGPADFSRWAIPQGQGALLGALQGEQPVAEAVNEVSTGGEPADAARSAADTVRAIVESQ